MSIFYKEIAGWKGFFAILVAFFHLEAFSLNEHRYFGSDFLAVEAFFIFSGFLLASELQNKVLDKLSISAIVFNKALKLYPIYLISLLLLVVFKIWKNGWSLGGVIPDFGAFCIEVSMLQMTGFFQSTWVNYPTWFISSLLIATAIILCVYKYTPKLVPLFGVVLTLMIYNYFFMRNSSLNSFEERSPFFLMNGNLRAIAAMFVGIFVFYLLNQSSDFIDRIKGFKLILCELVLIVFLAWLLFRNGKYSLNTYPFLIVFPLLFMVTLSRHSILAKVLGSKFMIWLGGLSVYIYMMHVLFIYLFKELLASMPKMNFAFESLLFAIFIIVLAAISKKVIYRFNMGHSKDKNY